MDPQIYEDLAGQEKAHWWFVSRRAIAASLFKKIKLPDNARILDAGCGSGGNLPLLAKFGEVFAFEMNDSARAHAASRSIGHVEAGKLPDAIPFGDTMFDLITLFDVLEHVEDDQAALRTLASRLKLGGTLYINVPAFQWLFGPMDRFHHHFRRYSRAEILDKVEATGLEIRLVNYWNCLLFPVAVAVRLMERFRKPRESSIGVKTPGIVLNNLLAGIVSGERFFIPHIRLPFGLSLIVIAQKVTPH